MCLSTLPPLASGEQGLGFHLWQLRYKQSSRGSGPMCALPHGVSSRGVTCRDTHPLLGAEGHTCLLLFGGLVCLGGEPRFTMSSVPQLAGWCWVHR